MIYCSFIGLKIPTLRPSCVFHAKFQGVEVERGPSSHPADCHDCPVRALFRLLGSMFYSVSSNAMPLLRLPSTNRPGASPCRERERESVSFGGGAGGPPARQANEKSPHGSGLRQSSSALRAASRADVRGCVRVARLGLNSPSHSG